MSVNEQIMEKLVEIENRLIQAEKDVAELKKITPKPKAAEDEPCKKNEFRDPETGACLPKFPCDKGKHWSEELEKCVPDVKTEATSKLTGEGLTAEILSATDEAPQTLKDQWAKEDSEMSEVPTV